ncbi:MAG: ribosome silencing factor [Anaerolineales bacterium]
MTSILEEKKGEDIILLDIHGISDFTDYFVICSGTSERMLEALADDVMRQMRNQNQIRGREEGLPHDGWILVDYGGVILHLFSHTKRDYYRLEDLWGEGKILLHLQ